MYTSPESEVVMRLANEVRPHTFDEVVGQKEIVANIRQQSIRNKFFQGYTLCGQFGSGKTTIARIIQLAVNCHHKDENGNPCLVCDSCKTVLAGASSDIVEIDAASNTGVECMRTLKEDVQFMPSVLDKKVYIIDEVQRLSTGAFDALLKVLEEPPAHVVFVLCTTEKNKIPKTILSRTAVYNFGCICAEDIVAHLEKVCARYEITYDVEGLALIARNSQGAMRNALSMLEQISSAGDVTVKAVAEMLGVADCEKIASILDVMLATDEKETVSKLMELMDGGIEPASMISDMLDMLSDCIVVSYGGTISGTKEYTGYVSGLTKKYRSKLFSALIKELLSLREKYREMPDRSTVVCGIIAAFHGLDMFQRVRNLEKAVTEVAYTARSAAGREQIIDKVKAGQNMQDAVVEKKEAVSEKTEIIVEESAETGGLSSAEKSSQLMEVEQSKEYPFPVGTVVMMDERKFLVNEYREVNPMRTNVVLDDLTAAEVGCPISRVELLSVFEVKAKAYNEPAVNEQVAENVSKELVEETESVAKTVSEPEVVETAHANDAEDEVPFEEDTISVPAKESPAATEAVDLFAMYGIKIANTSGQNEQSAVSDKKVDLSEELERSGVLKAVVDFSCDVNDGEVKCREKKDEPMGRILNAFVGAGKLSAAVTYAG